MASREQFLDDYEISLVSGSDDSEDDRYSGDIGLSGSEDEEDAVEKILMMTLTLCTMLLTLVTMDSRKTQTLSIQEQEKAQTMRRIFFKARTLPGAGHLPKLLELAERT